MTFAFPGVDIHREGAETVVQSFVDSLVIEGLAQLIADDGVLRIYVSNRIEAIDWTHLLDPRVEEPGDLVDAAERCQSTILDEKKATHSSST